MPEEEGPWRVEAQFNATVLHRPAVTAVLTGAAALNSPQYKTVMSYFEACRKKDVDAVRGNVAGLEFKSTTNDSSGTRSHTVLSGGEWKIGD
jgi:hypothetical protein